MRSKVEKVEWITEHLKKMTKKEIKFRDPVVERVVDKFVSRSDVGYKNTELYYTRNVQLN